MTASIVTAWHRELAVACAFSTAARVGAEAMPRSEVDRLTENIALALATIEQEARAAQQVKYASAVRALAMIQWSEYDEGGEFCQDCNGDPGSGHREGCVVSAVLSTPAARAVLEQEGK